MDGCVQSFACTPRKFWLLLLQAPLGVGGTGNRRETRDWPEGAPETASAPRLGEPDFSKTSGDADVSQSVRTMALWTGQVFQRQERKEENSHLFSRYFMLNRP